VNTYQKCRLKGITHTNARLQTNRKRVGKMPPIATEKDMNISKRAVSQSISSSTIETFPSFQQNDREIYIVIWKRARKSGRELHPLTPSVPVKLVLGSNTEFIMTV